MEKTEKVNGLIFKELIKRGYSLEGNTRIWNIADSKLWYLKPDQAQAFLDLENSKDYEQDVIQKEIDLINGNMEEIISRLKKQKINLVDIGCGDGKKAVLFIDQLKNYVKMRYCPIDISDYMVEKALTKIRDTDVEEIVKFQWNISDFENLENVSNLLRVGDFKKNVFLLLGNTLGNFEIHELLYQIRSSMKGGDYLLIGNGLDNNSNEDLIKQYFHNRMDDYLYKIVSQLGLKKEDVKFGVRFQNSRIEMYYTILKNKKIDFQFNNVQFNKGDQILVAISYKYSKNDLLSFLNLYFDEVYVKTSSDDLYALALCKK